MSTLTEQWASGHKSHSADAENRIYNGYRCLRMVREFIDFNAVVDFGCGIGGWLRAAEILGAGTIQGIEGEWIKQAEVLVPMEKIRVADLAQVEISYRKEFDLAISIEVAEHLPETSADMFCRGLVSASDTILFSAATKGQTGIGHINEQPLSYWVAKFWSLGYVPLEPLRPYIRGDQNIYGWLRRNLVMFVSYSLLIRSPNLLRHARPLSDFALIYSAS